MLSTTLVAREVSCPPLCAVGELIQKTGHQWQACRNTSSYRATYHSRMPDATRTLYLVCYDIASLKRLYRVHKFLIGYKVGGQKSFFECWLTAGELRDVRRGLAERLNESDDRAHIFQLDPRQQISCLGNAQPANRGAFMIL